MERDSMGLAVPIGLHLHPDILVKMLTWKTPLSK
jgi:hypothetical protein